MSEPIRVLHHDNCFDGIASASVFSVFYQRMIDDKADFDYEGLAHRAGGYQLEDMLSGSTNVILDFKYSSSERLTWWFDHHESAFLSPEDEAHFRGDRSGRKFHDPDFRSCTKFIQHVAGSIFDCSLDDMDELIHWADIIDGAQFESAQSAVELKEPALQLMTVVEAVHDRNLIRNIIRNLQVKSLAEIAAMPEVSDHFARLHDKHLQAIEVLTAAMTERDSVVEFDISDSPIHAHNKFIPYHVFPDSVYTVGVSLEPSRAKVSVGTNPWTRTQPRHNLARICEKYGGGGHAVVAAISFRPEEIDEARKVAKEIGETLRRDP